MALAELDGGGDSLTVKLAGSDAVGLFSLQREVKALEMLSHRHILPILDKGEQDSWCYFVIPYIKNGTLRERLLQVLAGV